MYGTTRYCLPASLLVLCLMTGTLQAQQACSTYKIREGDTLGSISMAAYGTYNYQRIFNANRDLLKANPNNLPVNATLTLPCEDGRLTADAALGQVISQEETKQTAAATTQAYTRHCQNKST